MRRRGTITKARLDSYGNPTMEDILAFVNGGKYDRFFLERPREFPDGSRKYLTRKGAAVYGRLVSVIYACARCTGVDEDLVDTMDNILTET